MSAYFYANYPKTPKPPKQFFKECPVCGSWVTNPDDYIYSLRADDKGKYKTVELCRKCRDKGH